MLLLRFRNNRALLLTTCFFLALLSIHWLHSGLVSDSTISSFPKDLDSDAPLNVVDQYVGPWSWDANKDRDNHRLTDAHCSAAFPSLFKEIDRAAGFWNVREGQTGIKESHIDLDWSWDGGLRCMIYNQQLYIIYSRGLNHFGHWAERHRGTLDNIYRAIVTSPSPVPNIEFSIKINDEVNLTDANPDTTFWTFSRNIHNPVHEQLWVIPDFNFWAYPRVAGSFSDFQYRALQAGKDFDEKIPKLVWRGTLDFNADIRRPLLEQTKDKPWSDVARVDEDIGNDFRISMEDHCRYKFAVHTEGTTWSGRLKYLLSCNSVIFIHPLKYFTHLYHLLEAEGAEQNYMAVKSDWSDLPEKIDGLLQDEAAPSRIASKAASVFRDRYATPAAQTCYFRRLFQTWSEVSFKPRPFETTKLKDGTEIKRMRGITYEEYM